MIASVAGFDPCKVEAVAALPYALTLWTYWQREDAAYMDELKREFERIDGANMIASGMSASGNKLILSRLRTLQAQAYEPVGIETVAEIEQRADELWAQHERAIKKRPVS